MNHSYQGINVDALTYQITLWIFFGRLYFEELIFQFNVKNSDRKKNIQE